VSLFLLGIDKRHRKTNGGEEEPRETVAIFPFCKQRLRSRGTMEKGTLFELVAYLRLKRGTLLFCSQSKYWKGPRGKRALFPSGINKRHRKRNGGEEEPRKTVAVFLFCKQKRRSEVQWGKGAFFKLAA